MMVVHELSKHVIQIFLSKPRTIVLLLVTMLRKLDDIRKSFIE